MQKELLPTPESLTLSQIQALFEGEAKAIAFLEAIRWPNGVTCLCCQNNNQEKIWTLKANKEKKIREGLHVYQIKHVHRRS